MNTENSRFKHFRKSLGFTQEIFSNKLNIKQASLSDVERGKVKVSANLLAILMKKYRLNPFWLIEGKGVMQLTPTQYNMMTSDVLYPIQEGNYLVEEEHFSRAIKDRNLLINTVSYELYINWALNKELNPEALQELTPIRLPEISGQSRTFQIVNDRMLPTLLPGDYVACTRISYPGSVISNGIYIVVCGTYGIIVGRGSYQESTENLKLSADNKESSKSVNILWKDIAELWEVKLRITSSINDAFEARLKALEKFVFKDK